MPETTNVVPIKPSMTQSERERVEQLVWTPNQGRGWREPVITSSDLPCLEAALREFEDRDKPADRVFIVASLARLANHFRSDRPADAWQMLFDDYASDLFGISEPHLSEAIEAQRR